MFSIVKIAIFTLFVGSYCAQPQYVGTVQDLKAKGWGNAENDLIISWQLESRDVTTSQVSVSNRQGHEITSLKILGLVPDASSLTSMMFPPAPGDHRCRGGLR